MKYYQTSVTIKGIVVIPYDGMEESYKKICRRFPLMNFQEREEMGEFDMFTSDGEFCYAGSGSYFLLVEESGLRFLCTLISECKHLAQLDGADSLGLISGKTFDRFFEEEEE